MIFTIMAVLDAAYYVFCMVFRVSYLRLFSSPEWHTLWRARLTFLLTPDASEVHKTVWDREGCAHQLLSGRECRGGVPSNGMHLVRRNLASGQLSTQLQ